MKKTFSKTAILVGIALAVSAPAFAQESKLKVERPGYELKIKEEGNEFKYKETGRMPVESQQVQTRQTTIVKEGRTMTTVRAGAAPEPPKVVQAKPVAKKCACPAKKSTAARKPVAKKTTVAYKAKPKTHTTKTSVARTAPKPVIVRDTVFVTRVDTVINMIEPAYFTGYSDKMTMRDDFKKLKIERDNDGEITIKKEYEDGREVKRKFANEEEFNTYMEWKNF